MQMAMIWMVREVSTSGTGKRKRKKTSRILGKLRTIKNLHTVRIGSELKGVVRPIFIL